MDRYGESLKLPGGFKPEWVRRGRGAMTIKKKRTLGALEKSGGFIFIYLGLNCCWRCSVSSLNVELELKRKVRTRNRDFEFFRNVIVKGMIGFGETC